MSNSFIYFKWRLYEKSHFNQLNLFLFINPTSQETGSCAWVCKL